ncbi:hypothetical protein M8J75_000779 [Diaphorina citri]|nr:hypothetical protein M8J75_000779 [Diaphorina citri]
MSLENVEKIDLVELVDLSIGSPEQGAVNFNLIKSVLHIIIGQLMKQDEIISVEFRGSSADIIRNLKENASTSVPTQPLDIRIIRENNTKDTAKTESISSENTPQIQTKMKPSDGDRFKRIRKTEVEKLKEEQKNLKEEQKHLKDRMDNMTTQMNNLIQLLPNSVHITPMLLEQRFKDLVWVSHESGYRTEPSKSDKIDVKIWQYDKNISKSPGTLPDPKELGDKKDISDLTLISKEKSEGNCDKNKEIKCLYEKSPANFIQLQDSAYQTLIKVNISDEDVVQDSELFAQLNTHGQSDIGFSRDNTAGKRSTQQRSTQTYPSDEESRVNTVDYFTLDSLDLPSHFKNFDQKGNQKHHKKAELISKMKDINMSSLYGRNRHCELDDPDYLNSDMYDDKGLLKPMYDAGCFQNAYNEALKMYSSSTVHRDSCIGNNSELSSTKERVNDKQSLHPEMTRNSAMSNYIKRGRSTQDNGSKQSKADIQEEFCEKKKQDVRKESESSEQNIEENEKDTDVSTSLSTYTTMSTDILNNESSESHLFVELPKREETYQNDDIIEESTSLKDLQNFSEFKMGIEENIGTKSVQSVSVKLFTEKENLQIKENANIREEVPAEENYHRKTNGDQMVKTRKSCVEGGVQTVKAKMTKSNDKRKSKANENVMADQIVTSYPVKIEEKSFAKLKTYMHGQDSDTKQEKSEKLRTMNEKLTKNTHEADETRYLGSYSTEEIYETFKDLRLNSILDTKNSRTESEKTNEEEDKKYDKKEKDEFYETETNKLQKFKTDLTNLVTQIVKSTMSEQGIFLNKNEEEKLEPTNGKPIPNKQLENKEETLNKEQYGVFTYQKQKDRVIQTVLTSGVTMFVNDNEEGIRTAQDEKIMIEEKQKDDVVEDLNEFQERISKRPPGRHGMRPRKEMDNFENIKALNKPNTTNSGYITGNKLTNINNGYNREKSFHKTIRYDPEDKPRNIRETKPTTLRTEYIQESKNIYNGYIQATEPMNKRVEYCQDIKENVQISERPHTTMKQEGPTEPNTKQRIRPPERRGQRPKREEPILKVDKPTEIRNTHSFRDHNKSVNVLHFNANFQDRASSLAVVNPDILNIMDIASGTTGSMEDLSALFPQNSQKKKYNDLVRIVSDLLSHLTTREYDPFEKKTGDALNIINQILADIMVTASSSPSLVHQQPQSSSISTTVLLRPLQDKMHNLEKEITLLNDMIQETHVQDKKRTKQAGLNKEAVEAIKQLQKDMKSIQDKLGQHSEVIEQNKLCLESLCDYIKEMDYKKIDRKEIDLITNDIIQRSKLDEKVAKEEFQKECQELGEAIKNANAKVDMQRRCQMMQSDIINQTLEMVQENLPKKEFDELTDSKIKAAMSKLEKKLKGLAEDNEQGASGAKKPALRDMYCISCNNEVVMMDKHGMYEAGQPIPPSTLNARYNPASVLNNCMPINRYVGGSNTKLSLAQKRKLSQRAPFGEPGYFPPHISVIAREYSGKPQPRPESEEIVFQDIVLNRPGPPKGPLSNELKYCKR